MARTIDRDTLSNVEISAYVSFHFGDEIVTNPNDSRIVYSVPLKNLIHLTQIKCQWERKRHTQKIAAE
jgi:hypothetical protein